MADHTAWRLVSLAPQSNWTNYGFSTRAGGVSEGPYATANFGKASLLAKAATKSASPAPLS